MKHTKYIHAIVIFYVVHISLRQMNESFLAMPCFVLRTIADASKAYIGHTYHINAAFVILLHLIRCDGFYRKHRPLPRSKIGLKKPSSPLRTDMFQSNLRLFEEIFDSNYTCMTTIIKIIILVRGKNCIIEVLKIKIL